MERVSIGFKPRATPSDWNNPVAAKLDFDSDSAHCFVELANNKYPNHSCRALCLCAIEYFRQLQCLWGQALNTRNRCAWVRLPSLST